MTSLSQSYSKSNNQLEVKNNHFDGNDVIDDDDFVIVSDRDIKSDRGCEILPTINEMNTLESFKSDSHNNAKNNRSRAGMEVCEDPCDGENIDDQILKIEKEFDEWIKLRRDTVAKLRDIADYIGTYFVILLRYNN